MRRIKEKRISKSAKFAVSELFTSIQGESSYAGRICFFIRLAGCNLNCSWCDTEYARSKIKPNLTIHEIIRNAELSGAKIVEITGGEPLVHDGVFDLCAELIKKGFEVLVETNGSISIKALPRQVKVIMDCKCPSSGESSKMLFKNFKLLNKKDEVKFVIADRIDYDYSNKILKKYSLLNKTKKVFFCPVANLLRPKKLAGWMIEDKCPAIFAVQLHKIIWGKDAKGR